jgi:ElaB/YqjD/DUF883 family membrane-anchored ribosome-binding protein
MPIYDENEPNKSFIDKIRQKRGVDPDVLQRPPNKKSAQENYDELKALENNQNAINEQLGLGSEKNFRPPSATTSGVQSKQNLFEKAKGLISRNPKKSIGIGATAGLSIGIVTIGLIGLGPLEVITLSENLKNTFLSDHEDASSNRATKLLFYAKSGGDYSRTRLGVLGNTHADAIDRTLAKKGVFVKYTSGAKFTYVFDATKGTPKLSEKEALKEAKALKKAAELEGIKTGRVEGHTYVVESEGKFLRVKYDRFVNKFMMRNLTDFGKVMTAQATRTQNKRAALPKWNVLARADTAINEKRNTLLKNLKDRLTGKKNTPRAEGTTAPDDAPEAEKTKAADTRATADAGNTAGEDLRSGKSTASKFFGAGKVAGGVSVAGIGLLCMVKAGVEDIDGTNRLIAKLNTLNAFSLIFPLGDEAKSGDFNIINYQGLGEIAKMLRADPDLKKQAEKNGETVYESSALQNYEDSKYQSVVDTSGAKLPDELRQDKTDSSIGQFLSSIPGLDPVCKAANSSVALVIGIVTGPLTTAVTAAITPVVMNIVTNFFKNDVVDWTKNIYYGGVLKEAIYAGGREYSNQLWYQDGGRPLSDEEIAIENNIEKENFIADNRSKSFKEKYLNIYDSSSTANRVALSFNNQNIAGLPEKLLSSFSSILGPKIIPSTSAASPVSDTAMYYGTRKAKLTTAFQDKYTQPYETSEEARQILMGPGGEKYKKLIEQCFHYNVEVSENTLDFKSIDGTEEDPNLIDPDKKDYPSECKNDNDENLNKIRDALMSLNSMKRLACYEYNDSESCKEIFPEAEAGDNCTDGGSNGQAPPDDYSKKAVGNNLISERTAFMIKQAEDYSGVKLTVAQGSYCTQAPQGCAGASAGTHNGGGVVDFSVSGLSNNQINKVIKGLREAGFAAWYRSGAAWVGNLHIHAVAIGDKEIDPAAKPQIQNYLDGLDGLSGSNKDPHQDIGVILPDWAKEIVGNKGKTSGNDSCNDGIPGSKDYTDDTANPIPKGEEVAAQAIKWANNDPGCNFMGGTCYRLCLGIVSELWKSVGKELVNGETAYDAYKRYKANGWVNKTKNIPVGAIMWSAKPGDPGDGHAYTYVGDGKIASNDIKSDGKYSIVPADWIETKWNHEFLGWSEWHN